tara:strand:+ start:1714 stop:2379 length:666 start_codon:yes stop_codon:yes gene_type:complete
MLKNLILIFTLKKIPKPSWSSDHEFNLKPNKKTLFYLIIGLILFGIGETLILTANIGVSPWFVLHQGLSFVTGFSIGITTFIVSVLVLLLWIPIKQKPGIGTLSNAIIISIVVDLSLPFLPYPDDFILKLLQVVIAMILIGVGSGFYLTANLGPGPRDGLMTGLQRLTNFSFTLIRTILEIAAVLIGFYLGGLIGLGTIIYAILVGPSVSLGLYIVGKLFK